ncbi:AAA family ATPase [Variovorax sp. RT4R15]|uniref:AAA family ATPase n=1 Tax=Variovorax sp. RT4R15 TaxID=3443737 RepID=UPI003F44D4B9
MIEWTIYDPERPAAEERVSLPPPPPWRQPGLERLKAAAEAFRPTPEVVDAVNTALVLRRPLLLTGKPGTGKSSLIYSISQQLRLGAVLTWNIHSRSTLQEGLYQYDALARLQHLQELQIQRPAGAARQAGKEAEDIAAFVSLGPLGAALASTTTPRALLIDEIDKSDVDLPNDLLNVLDTGSFPIPELQRIAKHSPDVVLWTPEGEEVPVHNGLVRFTDYPVIVMTSNGERDFPAAFLRRCVQCPIEDPTANELAGIVISHFGKELPLLRKLVDEFVNERQRGSMAVDQVMNAAHLLTDEDDNFESPDIRRVLKVLFRRLS